MFSPSADELQSSTSEKADTVDFHETWDLLIKQGTQALMQITT